MTLIPRRQQRLFRYPRYKKTVGHLQHTKSLPFARSHAPKKISYQLLFSTSYGHISSAADPEPIGSVLFGLVDTDLEDFPEPDRSLYDNEMLENKVIITTRQFYT
jgi:hypothetical protein